VSRSSILLVLALAAPVLQADDGVEPAAWRRTLERIAPSVVSIQVDGTEGSAVAGLRGCRSQHRINTPRPTWNPDIENPFDFFADRQEVPDNGEFDNAFKYQWELFLRHVAIDAPFIHDFYEGAKGVQLAELGLKSWAEQRWLDVPALPDAPAAARA